jgi:hypothetical protein
VPKKRLILLALSVAALAGGFYWALGPAPEPVYQGRRLSEWLDDYNRATVSGLRQSFGVSWSEESPKWQPIAKALRAMGTNTLPFLQAHVEHTRAPWEQKLIVILGRQNLFRFSSYIDGPHAASSVFALSTLGSNALPVLPSLLKAEEKSPGQLTLKSAIVALGTNALPGLEALCQNGNPRVRADAAECLAVLNVRWFAPRGRHTVTRQTRNGPLYVRYYWTVYSASFANLLHNSNAAVRRASADAIVFRGISDVPKTGEVNALLANLKDLDPQVRKSAADALKTIDPTTAANVGLK